MGAGVVDGDDEPGGARAGIALLGVVGVPMPAVQQVEIAGPVRGKDRHVRVAGLLQIVDHGPGQRRQQGVERTLSG